MMPDVDGDVVIKEEASELNGNKSPIDGAGRETWPETTRNKYSSNDSMRKNFNS